MADNSLDDFFAKKDKSKKKSKSKKTDVDDGSTKVKKEKKKDKESQNNGLGQDSGQNKVEVEEWKDFEEEKEVDYTGLKIANLQIAKDNEERDAGSGEEEGDGEDGEERREGRSGPWNKAGEVQPPVKKVAPPPAPVEEPPAGPKIPGKYVPPSLRNSGGGPSPGMSSVPQSRRKKEAPNVNSEEDFPTLGGGGGRWSQQPGYGDVNDNPALRKGVALSLGNRFSSLQD